MDHVPTPDIAGHVVGRPGNLQPIYRYVLHGLIRCGGSEVMANASVNYNINDLGSCTSPSNFGNYIQGSGAACKHA